MNISNKINVSMYLSRWSYRMIVRNIIVTISYLLVIKFVYMLVEKFIGGSKKIYFFDGSKFMKFSLY